MRVTRRTGLLAALLVAAVFSMGHYRQQNEPIHGSKSVTLLAPTTADAGKVQLVFRDATTLVRVWCSTDTGTATIQFDERAEATPNTAGVDVLTSALVCDATSEATTSFANASIALRVPMNLDIDATSGTPGVVRIHVEW